MLFFTRAFFPTSRFSVMINKMFFGDLLYFLSVYLFMWIGFASAMQALLSDEARRSNDLGDLLYSMLNVVTDAGEKSDRDVARLPRAAAIVLSLYAIVTVVLLLNMLIAMMNASYEAVKMSKTNLYRYQQLSILLLIERRLFWWGWLCRRSQKCVMTPAAVPDVDVHPSENVAYVEIGREPVKTAQRLYMAVTERSHRCWANDCMDN